MVSTEETENNASRNTHHDRKLKFLRAALDEKTRDEALYILAQLTMDELDELDQLLGNSWIRSAVDRQIQLYEMGEVRRHVPDQD